MDKKKKEKQRRGKERFERANALLRREMALMKQAASVPHLLIDNVKEIAEIRKERRKIHGTKS